MTLKRPNTLSCLLIRPSTQRVKNICKHHNYNVYSSSGLESIKRDKTRAVSDRGASKCSARFVIEQLSHADDFSVFGSFVIGFCILFRTISHVPPLSPLFASNVIYKTLFSYFAQYLHSLLTCRSMRFIKQFSRTSCIYLYSLLFFLPMRYTKHSSRTFRAYLHFLLSFRPMRYTKHFSRTERTGIFTTSSLLAIGLCIMSRTIPQVPPVPPLISSLGL